MLQDKLQVEGLIHKITKLVVILVRETKQRGMKRVKLIKFRWEDGYMSEEVSQEVKKT